MIKHTAGAAHGSVASLSIGFILSIGLTVLSFVLVGKDILSGSAILGALAILAALQLAVQLVFFLHLGKESGPRWNLFAFAFMGLIAAIIIIGTLWIMANMNYHMMSPEESDTYMLEQKDKGF